MSLGRKDHDRHSSEPPRRQTGEAGRQALALVSDATRSKRKARELAENFDRSAAENRSNYLDSTNNPPAAAASGTKVTGPRPSEATADRARAGAMHSARSIR